MSAEMDWLEVRLEEVADEITVGFVGPMADEYRSTGVPFFRSLNIKPFRVQTDDLKFISPEFHHRIRKSRLKPGDVVIIRTGDPGTATVIPDIFTDANCSDLVIVRPSKRLNPHFLAYYVNAVAHHQISAQIVGAVQQHFNVGSAKQLTLTLPPRVAQDAIADVLRIFDRKLELNRRMNRTLEELAGALFRAWFVDFEPVVAKAAGRAPFGIAPAVAALFPAAFTDSELGPIPLGWRVIPVGDVMQIHDSKRIPVSGAERAKRPGKFPYYGAASVMDYIDDYIFDGVFLLLGEDGSVVDSDGYPVTQYVWGQIWVNNHAHVITGGAEVSTEMLLLFFRETMLSPYVTGAVQPKLNQQNLKSVPFICPTVEVSKQFAQIVAPWFARLRHNEEESRTLAALRDTLLPKLLSGELRVKDAEKLA